MAALQECRSSWSTLPVSTVHGWTREHVSQLICINRSLRGCESEDHELEKPLSRGFTLPLNPKKQNQTKQKNQSLSWTFYLIITKFKGPDLTRLFYINWFSCCLAPFHPCHWSDLSPLGIPLLFRRETARGVPEEGDQSATALTRLRSVSMWQGRPPPLLLICNSLRSRQEKGCL